MLSKKASQAELAEKDSQSLILCSKESRKESQGRTKTTAKQTTTPNTNPTHQPHPNQGVDDSQ
jgi:hypothetical protein